MSEENGIRSTLEREGQNPFSSQETEKDVLPIAKTNDEIDFFNELVEKAIVGFDGMEKYGQEQVQLCQEIEKIWDGTTTPAPEVQDLYEKLILAVQCADAIARENMTMEIMIACVFATKEVKERLDRAMEKSIAVPIEPVHQKINDWHRFFV